jgi:hypothetical protein
MQHPKQKALRNQRRLRACRDRDQPAGDVAEEVVADPASG